MLQAMTSQMKNMSAAPSANRPNNLPNLETHAAASNGATQKITFQDLIKSKKIPHVSKLLVKAIIRKS